MRKFVLKFPRLRNKWERGEKVTTELIQENFPELKITSCLIETATERPARGWKQTHTKAHRCEISEHWDKEKSLQIAKEGEKSDI